MAKELSERGMVGEVEPHSSGLGGTQRRYRFANGYGASIITGMYTMGADYELAVLSPDGKLSYDTHVTSDVERGDAARMNELLAAIEALPEAKP